ncbi:hypothetical protein [Pectobacterium carotovorum]|uniref:hypothetical protein n=1 Tax=Pectobacterium carotovorum TaxID=554 RepID=UPI000508D6FD|nr:hypothetical protein [Pectobacterium carotovorum]KFW97581.1 hypothetical protein JV33_21500 [Pectobacterium carotovorum subsp. carotovorum]KML64949.1 hypothetical protein G032_21020 [Pectobacterium carotovorum subsp. carotovorum ICMP 5702]SHH68327.1 hypothetical protein SAMN05444147_11617 [Pectobacterium carotovorum]
MLKIDIPDIRTQKDMVRRDAVRKACIQLDKNLLAEHIPGPVHFDYRQYGTRHLNVENDGWEPPAAALVNAWFEHFKSAFPEYGSDKKLGILLGLNGNVDRRIRSFRNGERPVPYGVWRHFLVITGRVSQEIIPVLVIIDDES